MEHLVGDEHELRAGPLRCAIEVSFDGNRAGVGIDPDLQFVAPVGGLAKCWRGRGRWRPCGRRQSDDLSPIRMMLSDRYSKRAPANSLVPVRHERRGRRGRISSRGRARNPPGQSAPSPAASLAGLSTGEQPRWVHCRSSRLVSPEGSPYVTARHGLLGWPRWWRFEGAASRRG